MFDEVINAFSLSHSIAHHELLSEEHIDKLETTLEKIDKRFGEEVANLVAIVLFEEACRKDSNFKDRTFQRLKQELTEKSYQKAENLFAKVKLEKIYLETEEIECELMKMLSI